MEKKSPKSGSGRMMQNVKFDSVVELLDFLPEDELKITLYLRQLIMDCVPDVEEKLSYNVPFYRRNAGIFFIWPGSVSWGKVVHPGVRFGFQQGYLLDDEIGYLDRGGRKQVFWRDYLSLESIDVELLRAYLFAAVEVDDGKAKRKRK
jgi:hypothetical protein